MLETPEIPELEIVAPLIVPTDILPPEKVPLTVKPVLEKVAELVPLQVIQLVVLR